MDEARSRDLWDRTSLICWTIANKDRTKDDPDIPLSLFHPFLEQPKQAQVSVDDFLNTAEAYARQQRNR